MFCPIRDTPHAVSPRPAAPQVGALKYHKFSIKLPSNFKISFSYPFFPHLHLAPGTKKHPNAAHQQSPLNQRQSLSFQQGARQELLPKGQILGFLHGDPARCLVPEWQTSGMFSPW